MKKLSFALMSFIGMIASTAAFAETGAAAAGSSGFDSNAIGAAIIMAFASSIGAYSQSRAAAAALEGIARNPQAQEKVQTPLVLSLALMESLVLFAFVIAIMLVLK